MAALPCEYGKQINIDTQCQTQTHVNVNQQAKCFLKDEKLFRLKRWNLINYKLKKLFISKTIVVNPTLIFIRL